MFLLSLLSVSGGIAQHNCVNVKMSIIKTDNTDSTLPNSLNFKINVLSKCTKKVKIHSEDFFIINKHNDNDVDGYFEVKSINDDKSDSVQDGTTDCDRGVVNIPPKSEFKILSKNQSVEYYSPDLRCFYLFLTNHTYRIRFYYKLSRFNPSFKDVCSDWLLVKF